MQKLFSNILAPIDPNKQSELAVSKAIFLCNKFKCNLHIICIGEPVGAVPFLKQRYGEKLSSGLSLFITTHKGNAEQIIVEYAILHYIDLVVMGSFQKPILGNLFGTLSINRLSWKVNQPVLTLKLKEEANEINDI